MPRKGPERREDRAGYDPAQNTALRKVARLEFGNPIIDAAIRAGLLALLGSGTGYVASEQKSAELEALKTQVLELESSQENRWKRLYDRRRQEREAAQRTLISLEGRFVRLETRAGIPAPPAAAIAVPEALPTEPER